MFVYMLLKINKLVKLILNIKECFSESLSLVSQIQLSFSLISTHIFLNLFLFNIKLNLLFKLISLKKTIAIIHTYYMIWNLRVFNDESKLEFFDSKGEYG